MISFVIANDVLVDYLVILQKRKKKKKKKPFKRSGSRERFFL